MTVNDMMKRLKKMPKDKMIIFHDGNGWANVAIEERKHNVVITMDCRSPFSDGG